MAVGRPTRLAILGLVAAALAGCGRSGPEPDAPLASSPDGVDTPLVSVTPSPVNSAGDSLLIVNGTLIDGTGADPVRDSYVFVRGGRIEARGSGPPLPAVIAEASQVIDAEGGTIMPGLIDAHVHISGWLLGNEPGSGTVPASERLLPWLQAGFTTLRDMGTTPALFPSVKATAGQLEDDSLAPRIVWAGPIIAAVGGYPVPVPAYAPVAREVSSRDEARDLVNQLIDDGATVIKLGLEQGYYEDLGWPLLDSAVISVISGTAHSRGARLTAHVTSIDELRLALDGGVDDLAHAPLEPLPDDLIAAMVRDGVGMATTATVWGRPDAQAAAAANLKRFAEVGGVVAIATDFGCCDQTPGIEPYLVEMRFLSSVGGMSPMQLLVAATRGGAVLAGRSDIGTIEAGTVADIIIVDGDPLVDFDALRNIRAVIKSGRVVAER